MSDYLLIFDFDGTLANSIDAGMKHANSLAKRFKYEAIDDIEIVRQQSAVNYIYAQIKWYYLPFWAIAMKRRLKKSAPEIPMFQGIVELLSKLNDQFKLGIISGNSKTYIQAILDRHKSDFFTFKIPNNGAKKHNALKKLIKSGYRSDRIIFIGDDLQDIQSAKKVSIKTIAVTWGSSSVDLLTSAKADRVSTTVQELELAISELSKQDHY